MPETLEDKLVIGISSRALFDLGDANAVFEQEGLSAYREYQREHEFDVLAPGTTFPLVKGLLNVNERAGEQLVDVIVFSRNDADTGMRVLRSVEAHGLPITRAVFRGGRELAPMLRALGCDLFLSAQPAQVLKARERGVAAALIMPGTSLTEDDPNEVRIAFDGDAVVFGDASQQLYDAEGLDAFHAHERTMADEPMSPGPFRPFLEGLARIQDRFGASSPIRTALVTARAAPAHYRVINTLRAWGLHPDETYFLGGVDKAAVLKAFGAHIFFDDQRVHVESASTQVPAAQVLWPEDDLPAEVDTSSGVAVSGRARKPASKRGAKKTPKASSKTKPSPSRAASGPAAPRGPARSGH